MGKVKGKQKDRGKGPGNSRPASQLKTSAWPLLCSLPLPVPLPRIPSCAPHHPETSCLPAPAPGCLIWPAFLWIPASGHRFLPSPSRSLSLSLFL